ncbi:MAG: metallo-mystery pair system four-Cys motif protein [Chloroflexota bacterium]
MFVRTSLRVLVSSFLLVTLLAVPTPTTPAVDAQESQRVEVHFRAMVGEEPFACGQRYGGIGTTGATVLPSDFRFYVSDVSLLDAGGNAVPLALEQDGRWQFQNVALLDFENKNGPCANGTEETRDLVIGTVPAGTYTGLRFTLGVPFDLNHQDSTIAPSPLNLTSLFWTWQAGYKFFRVDLEPDRAAMPAMGMPKPDGAAAKPHGAAPAGHGADPSTGWAIHLGSTGCQAGSMMQAPADCTNPNRSTVEFASFDHANGVVVADLKTLLAGANVETNQPESAFGCMSAPNDGDCASIMASFGLPFGGAPSPGQTLFRVQ